MQEITSQTIDNRFEKYIPIATVICCLVCLILFFGINIEGNHDTADAYSHWGAPLVFEIFGGSYWGLITSNFLHVEIFHIIFNLYWFWIFGKKIEFETNKAFYILLILSSALISSLAQLAFSDSTGIGISGVVYAFLAFIVVKGKATAEYRGYLRNSTINFFLFWLVLCLFLTEVGVLAVGNAAHVAGLFWGALIAFSSKYNKPVRWVIGLAYIAVLTVLIFFSPFSTSYLSYQAYQLHKAQKVEAAIAAYKKILRQDGSSEFAKQNLQQLEVMQLQEKAYELHANGQFKEARQVYYQILSIDKNNAWANENLSLLPPE